MKKLFRLLQPFLWAGVLALLPSCSLAPFYSPPKVPEPEQFKETAGWTVARPNDDASRGRWWTVFHDPQLNSFEEEVTAANQNLRAAVAQYDQARAAVQAARAAYFPTITASSGASRQQISQRLANEPPVTRYNDFTMGADLSYEIDLWGRVRNSVAANKDQAQATAADLAGLALSLHAEFANDYFALRGDDAAQQVLDETVDADQKAFDLTQRRYKGGVSPEADVDQAETQLQNAKTQAADMRLQRAQLEHALAILMGKAPADFNLAAATIDAQLPTINVPIPSVLLERRPDIAAAERRTAAANAEIGVARAAWFPVFSITGMLGLESESATRWISAPSQFWSLGPSAITPLFEGGQIDALTDEARAVYEQNAAVYRQTVLNAYGEVEDEVIALRQLELENQTQALATKSAERALFQSNNLYKDGAATYLDVVVNQNNELQAKLASVTILVRSLTTSVLLIEALGGDWQSETPLP